MLPRPASTRVLLQLLSRKQVAAPVLFSLIVHAALIAALVSWRLDAQRRPERLSEMGSSTVLNLAAERPAAATPPVPPPPLPKPEPPPPTPPPETTPQPQPQPSAPLIPPATAKDVIALAPAEPKPEAPPPAAASARPPPTDPPPPPPLDSKVTFAGMESKKAARIVYAIDASGSMASSLPFVKGELARSVAKLDPSQSFAVVVFREKLGGGESIETFASSTALLAATPRAKADLARWINTIEPSGRSSPVAGLRAAFDLRPDLVLLLTRNIRRSGGAAEAPAQTLAAVGALNPRAQPGGLRPIVVKVLQFVEDDPTGLMQAIAEAHGDGPGSYRVVPVE